MRMLNNIDKALNNTFKLKDTSNFENLFTIVKENFHSWKPLTNNGDGLIDVIDFFSGCGGMSLGFSFFAQTAKIFNIVGGIDINEKAIESYQANFNCRTLKHDIRDLCSQEGVEVIRESFGLSKKKQKPLIIIGCAPCQGFSAHRKRNWHIEDERNTLIGAFTETAINFDPDFIVMENVREILGKKYWEHYEEARNILTSKGYIVKQAIYNCASFGVPQARFRAIIMASKKDFSLPNPILDVDNYRTVRDAISDLEPLKAGEISKKDPYHRSAKHKLSTIETITQIPKDGGSRPSGVGPVCLDKVNGFYDVYGRLYWDRPAITLTQYARNPASGRFTHPEQDRGLTIREAARLQSFPDSFIFKGSLDDCFKQIGESVPPLLSLAVATKIVLEFSSYKDVSNSISVKQIFKPINNSYSSLVASV